ncbi:MAG: hypothetical protein R3325_14925 [Thermoanaerobaculia bacterium]|nr:hypothetical protein [Thermoanaerobaculia bacterium]
MRRLRGKAAVLATLLLATLATTGAVEQSHAHDALAGASGPAALPHFEAGHAAPDDRLHVEGAAQTEPAACLACLLRERQRGVEAPLSRLGGLSPGLATPVRSTVTEAVAGARRLPPSRAPPGS